MNDTLLIQLKAVVERAVRPIRASMVRKRRMREELLDHLVTIYEEELGRLGDEEAALEQAKRRFGDPADLTKELRASLSRWDRVCSVLDLQRYGPGESLLHLAARHLLLSAFGMTAMLLLMLLVIWMRGRINEIEIVLHVALVTCFFSAGFSFSFLLVVEQMGRALYGRGSRRPVRAMILCGLASLSVFPVLTFFTHWGLFGSLASGLSGFGLGSTVAPAAPLLFFLMARQMKDEILHESEWAGIEIEEAS